MLARLMQATVITLALYALLGVDNLQTSARESNQRPPEVIVALKQALVRR